MKLANILTLLIFYIVLASFTTAAFLPDYNNRQCFTITNETTIDANVGMPQDLNSQHFDFPNICTQTNFYDCLSGLTYANSPIPLSMETIDNNKGWFKLQAALAAGATSPSGEAGYCLYYDNPAASAPLFTDINMAGPGLDLNMNDVNVTLSLWHLNGDDVNDSSVNRTNLTEVGTIDTNADNVKYGLSSASGFNDSDYFTLAAAPMGGLTEFTVELDFFYADTGNAIMGLVSSEWPAAGSLLIHTDTTNYEVNIPGCVSATIPFANVAIGEWHHLTAWFDGTHHALEIDGEKSAIVACSTAASSDLLTIGRQDTGASKFWGGSIQNVKISNYVKNSNLYYTPNGWTPNQSYLTKVLGAVETAVLPLDANFTYVSTPLSSTLLQVTTTDTSDFGDFNLSNTWDWRVDGSSISTDQNIVNNFNIGQDYNLSLLITGLHFDGNFSSDQFDVTIDLNTPAIDYNLSNLDYCFSTDSCDTNITFTMRCVDSAGDDVNYLLAVNDVNLLDSSFTNDSQVDVNANLQQGVNTIFLQCMDSGGSIAEDNNSITAYIKNYLLIDEETTEIFDLSKVDEAIVFTPDANSFADLKDLGETDLHIFTVQDLVIRFELTYFGDVNVTINRDFSTSVVDDVNMNVCASEFQQFFEQLLISSEIEKVAVKNGYANCYSLADYTRLAFQDALSAKAITINKEYILYSWETGAQASLAVIDGAQALSINIDILQFKRRQYSLTIGEELISVSADANGILSIQYNNDDADNVSVRLFILDNNVEIWIFNETDNPNDFNASWDFSNITFVDEIIVVVARSFKATGDVTEVNVQFTPSSIIPFLNPEVAAILALVIFIFGISILVSNFSFSWFGGFFGIIALAITAMATPAWYLQFIQMIILIATVYIMLIYRNENAGVT